jgi:uncharacterized OsmC-like protein
MRLNNIDLDALTEFAGEVKRDLTKAKKSKQVECTWRLEEGNPQVESVVQFPTGEALLQADFAPFMGGSGLAPDPLQYCLFGLASCFASTFANTAAAEGVKLQRLTVSAENFMDLSRTMGLSNNPIVEKVKFTVRVKSEASSETLKKLEKLSKERCPAVFCLTQPISLETEVVKV